jgi:hypothetical protein
LSGLGDITQQGSPATYFSDTDEWLNTMILDAGRNPALSAADFHLVQKAGRSHLVTNSTIFYPAGVHLRRPAPGSPGLQPYPLEALSKGAGVSLSL